MVKIGRINVNKDRELVLVLIARRRVGNAFSVAVRTVNFAAVFLNLVSYVANL